MAVERSAAQLIDPNEELLDSAKDDRRLRAPAIGIGVMIILFAEQASPLSQQIA